MIGEQLAMRIKAVLFDLGGTLVDTPSDFDYENLLVPLHQSLVKNGVVVPFDEYRKVHVGIRDRIWSEDSLKEVAFASIICEALGMWAGASPVREFSRRLCESLVCRLRRQCLLAMSWITMWRVRRRLACTRFGWEGPLRLRQ